MSFKEGGRNLIFNFYPLLFRVMKDYSKKIKFCKKFHYRFYEIKMC